MFPSPQSGRRARARPARRAAPDAHAARAAQAGERALSARRGVDRIFDYADYPKLDEVDRLVVEYAIAVTGAPQRIRDGVFERLRRRFTEAQIVELTLRIALCGFFNRVNDALQIEVKAETPGDV